METPRWKERLSSERTTDERLSLYEFEEDEKERVDEMYASRSVSWWHAAYLGTAVLAVGTSRRTLTGRFPYPICFLAIIQATAYSIVVGAVLFIRIKNCWRSKRKCDPGEPRSWRERMREALRLLFYFPISATALMCGLESLTLSPNLHVLAMLPICTYIMNGVFLRIVYYCGFLDVEREPTFGGIFRILSTAACIFTVVHEDYRLSPVGLAFALAAYTLASLAKTISLLRPEPEHYGFHTLECGLRTYLLFGIPSLLITLYTASKLEDTTTALELARSWSIWQKLCNIVPAVMLQLIFRSSLNSAYRFRPNDAGGALDLNSADAQNTVALTLQSGFLIVCIGAQNERSLVSWLQILAFTVIYVICVGPTHIGTYPPRLLNFISRLFGGKPILSHSERWQFPPVLLLTSLVFTVLVSSSVVYWCDTAGYNRDLKTWQGPRTASLDTMYRPPISPQIDVVIAHSAEDSLESISSLISAFTSIAELERFKPHIKLYTKDASLKEPDFGYLVGEYDGEFTSTVLANVGGITATFLHHFLYTWEFLPIQTLFLTTTNNDLALTTRRLQDYFITPGSPIPDALPKTGFLNLGDYASCSCGSCSDSHGWNDSFHLVPSMFGASRPGADGCDSILLTYGNNFLASAARIRGVKRDLWQMLYDALVKEDVTNAWAHDRNRMPKTLPRKTEIVAPWREQGVYEVPDSLERPWLGFTVERLWGVLLQCSQPELAWRCPDMRKGWRTGGEREDCSCID